MRTLTLLAALAAPAVTFTALLLACRWDGGQWDRGQKIGPGGFCGYTESWRTVEYGAWRYLSVCDYRGWNEREPPRAYRLDRRNATLTALAVAGVWVLAFLCWRALDEPGDLAPPKGRTH